jgi:hypothetical protein
VPCRRVNLRPFLNFYLSMIRRHCFLVPLLLAPVGITSRPGRKRRSKRNSEREDQFVQQQGSGRTTRKMLPTGQTYGELPHDGNGDGSKAAPTDACAHTGGLQPTKGHCPALMDLYIHPLYVLVSKILSSILNSSAPIHPLYHPLSTLSTVELICHFI